MKTISTAAPVSGETPRKVKGVTICPLSLLFSAFVGVVGVVVIAGWVAQNHAIVQILPGLAPMQATTALGFIFFAGAVFFLAASFPGKRGALKYVFSGAVLLWGILNLCQHAFGINIGIDGLMAEPFVTDRSPAPGRMSVLTSVCFVMGGVATLLACFIWRKAMVEVVIIFLAGILAGASGSVLFSYAASIPPVVWLGERFSEMAVHTALGFFLLSLGIITQRFRCGRATYVEALRWMWIPVFCAVFFASVSIYYGLATNAVNNRKELARLQAEAMAELLSARLFELEEALSRMGSRVAGLGLTQRELWEADARHYMQDFQSLSYVEVRGGRSNVDWSYPQSETSRFASWSKEVEDSSDLDHIDVVIFPGKKKEQYILLHIHESLNGNSDEPEVLLFAFVDWRQLIRRTIVEFEKTGQDAHFDIHLEPVGSDVDHHPQHLYAQHAPYDSTWQWTVEVNPELLPLNTKLQNFFLAGGVFISVLLAYLVHSIQQGRERLKQLEAAQWTLARQKSRLEAFVNHAPASVAMFDRNICYIAASVHWIKDYELEGVRILGRSHYDVFPNISDDWKQIHQRCLEGHVEHRDRDCWRPAGWEHDQYLRWEVRPWREPDGSIGGIMMFTTDITADVQRESEIIAMRKAADEANELKSQFLANMSHEIRTPMNGVVGMTSLLHESDLNNEQSECVKVIRESADALLTLIDDILDFSKIEAGKIELEKEQFSLTELVATTVELLAPMAATKHNELMAWVEVDGLVEILGDSGRLRQIITNLLGNAIKFTEGGDITLLVTPVNTTAHKIGLRFEVKDTGIGMTEEQCQRIFQPFVQADGSTARKYGGTGLGLSISERLVEAMGGALDVQSEPGEGTVFSFSLTFELPEDANSLAAPTAPLDCLAGKNCLMVFYSANAAKLVEARLRKWGLDTRVALSVESAKERIKEQAQGEKPFDLILLDSSLGFDFPLDLPRMLELEALPADSRPAVVLLKSVGMSLTLDQARATGIKEFIRKPLTASRIFDCLSNLYQSRLVGGAAAQMRDHIPIAQFKDLRLLVAEDNAVNRKVISMLLHKMGIEVDTVSDGQEAIEAWEKIHYPVILMDCQMPGVDGLTASRQIRERHQARTEHGENIERPYIIALTANTFKDDRERCISAGMDDYLSKPARWEKLQETLKRWQQNRSPTTTS